MQTDNRRKDSRRTTELFGFIRYILKNYKIVVAAALAGIIAASAYVFVFATPKYEATAQIYVVSSKDSALNLSDLQIGSYLTSDYQLVFDTREVTEIVIHRLGLPYTYEQMQKMLKLTNPSNTRVLLITIRSSDANEAAMIANEYAEVAKEYITDTMQTEMPTTLSDAFVPEKPVSPKKMLTLAVCTLVAVLLAIWALFIKFTFDDQVKTSDDVLRLTGARPLAVIPLTGKNTTNDHRSDRR